MKRVVLLFVAAVVALVGFGEVQAQKKVAVSVANFTDPNVIPMIEDICHWFESAVDSTPGYEVFGRRAFEVIENKYGLSATASDAEIRDMGERAGVQYIIMPEASYRDIREGLYILAKMFDVERCRFGGVFEAVCNGLSDTEIRNTCIGLGKSLLEEVAGTGNKGGNAKGISHGNGSGNTSRGYDYTETAFGINMRMIYVEGGTFAMGCRLGESVSCEGCEGDEKPCQPRTVGSFHIGMLEVTQDQWEKVMGTTVVQQRDKADTGFTIAGVGGDYPMYHVEWDEAVEFCERLSRATGRKYSLPTEAEWEYAARGGSRSKGTKLAGGWVADDVAWYYDNSDESTHPCGTKQANELGLYDMSGNVAEWCEGVYGDSYYCDERDEKSVHFCYVLRGGDWGSSASGCHIAWRYLHVPGDGYDRGFRVIVR